MESCTTLRLIQNNLSFTNFIIMQPLTHSQLLDSAGGYDWKSLLKRAGWVGIFVDALGNLPDIREGFYDGYNGLPPRHQAS